MHEGESADSLAGAPAPLLESKAFKVISRSGITKLGQPEEGPSTQRKPRPKKPKQDSHKQSKKRLRAKQSNARLSKAAQSHKVVEKRKRKVSRVKKRDRDKKRSDKKLKPAHSGSSSQFRAPPGKIFKSELAQMRHKLRSRGQLVDGVGDEPDAGGMADFLLTKSSMNSTLHKGALGRKKSGALKSSQFANPKSRRRRREPHASLKAHPKKPRAKKPALGHKAKKASSKASLAHDKSARLRRRAERPKKQSATEPAGPFEPLEKKQFMNTTDFQADSDNRDKAARAGSYNNFGTEVKIRKSKFGPKKREVVVTSLDALPREHKQQRDLSYRNKLRQISSIKKTGSAFKESFTKKYYLKITGSRSNQVSQRKLPEHSRGPRDPRRENRLVDYLAEQEKDKEQDKAQDKEQPQDKAPPVGEAGQPAARRKAGKKQKNPFSFSENKFNPKPAQDGPPDAEPGDDTRGGLKRSLAESFGPDAEDPPAQLHSFGNPLIGKPRPKAGSGRQPISSPIKNFGQLRRASQRSRGRPSQGRNTLGTLEQDSPIQDTAQAQPQPEPKPRRDPQTEAQREQPARPNPIAFPSFNFHDDEEQVFGESELGAQESPGEQAPRPANRTSLGQRARAPEPAEPKQARGRLGESQDVRASDNLSFTPNDSFEHSASGFKAIFDNEPGNLLAMDSARKRFSNQGMAFQR
ncbi:MAG: hypothetical protein AAF368_00355 [Planctomycetota bacterium]